MRPTLWKTAFLTIILLSAGLFGTAAAATAFTDIENNWAREAIIAFEEEGLFEGIWEEKFLPHASLDHETALELVSRAFELTTGETKNLASWLEELLVADPEGITRGEFAALAGNLLGLGEHTALPGGWYPSFVDLEADYPALLSIEVLQRMDLLPSHYLRRFEPYRLITRSEATAILSQALELETRQGTLGALDPEQDLLVLAEGEEEFSLSLLPETLFVNPQGVAKQMELEPGDPLSILVDQDKALLVKTVNARNLQATLTDVINRAGGVLADVLTPAQVSAIVAGDWDQLNEEIRYELYHELVERGIAPWEAEALLKQDWGAVRVLAQERLTHEAADYLEVAPELIDAAFARNWPKVWEYAQVELAQRILSSDWLQGIERP